MKRSEIDRLIEDCLVLLSEKGVALPPQARWDLRTWWEKREEADELRRRGIGWDLTDFGSGDFNRLGLLLYTLSNGIAEGADDQPYANKLLVVGEGQITPTHHHWSKMEDIIVLRGGILLVEVHRVGPADALDRASEVRVLLNNAWTTHPPGAVLALGPGERVRLDQHHYHRFWGGEGAGPVIVEEVSMVNDDARDNCFLPEDGVGRFPEIEEDREPRHLLCTEMPGTQAFQRLVERYLA